MTDRILVTHTGSMPRPRDVADLLIAQDRGQPIDQDVFDDTIRRAVSDVVAGQLHAGVDIPSDGEMSKVGYATYTRHRLSGFEGAGAPPRAVPADLDAFPDYRDHVTRSGWASYFRPVCRGPVEMHDRRPLSRDIAHLRSALGNWHGDAFLNAASPGVIAAFQPNEYYPTRQAYLAALAEAMKTEYEEITNAGFLLQVDCPDLAMERHITFRDETDAQFVRHVDEQVDALNHALSGVPAERTRMHICWGNYEGPHTRDVPLATILRAVLKAKPSVLLFEAANPRHAHEWIDWQGVAIPEDKVLVPGVIDTTTNFVEHPQLVAERLCRFAGMVGRERVMAGTDCGFGTIADRGAVHPSVCWAKLQALAEGARIATDKLW